MLEGRREKERQKKGEREKGKKEKEDCFLLTSQEGGNLSKLYFVKLQIEKSKYVIIYCDGMKGK